jgi:RES domain-containing protein
MDTQADSADRGRSGLLLNRTVWRLVPECHASQPLSGEGAQLNGGRWNEPGVPIIYTSEHRSLAVVELWVHLGGITSKTSYQLQRYELDETLVQEIRETDLPGDWFREPSPRSTARWGTEGVKSGRSLAAAVPSAAVPHEKNILINPAHPRGGEVTAGLSTPFSFDSRLFARSIKT